MYTQPLRTLSCFFVLSLMTACANIVPPSGGPKDITPPKLTSVLPADSQLNTRVTRIEMKFDEYITVSDATKEVHVSPTLPLPPTVTGYSRSLVIRIPDSLLKTNTTYTISLGTAVKDLHEGNVYTGKPYIFSTGAWFDSLQLSGQIYDAATGLPDSSAKVRVLLYDTSDAADVVTRKKPAYVANSDNKGRFRFTGLPDRMFRMFALKESGDNLQFDNDDESVAFSDRTYLPSADTSQILLTIFQEKPDSLRSATAAAPAAQTSGFSSRKQVQASGGFATSGLDPKSFSYTVRVDTSDLKKRTAEINKGIDLVFSRKLRAVNNDRITLNRDSAGSDIPVAVQLSADSGSLKGTINSNWIPNTVYTLRLLKSFATDTAGTEALPSRYQFRTKQEADYGKMEIHIPATYIDGKHLLQVRRDGDSVYLKALSDSVVQLSFLSPGTYTLSVIGDLDGNGEWTTGDLKNRRQPEPVFPHGEAVLMKAGWEHVIDFGKKKR